MTYHRCCTSVEQKLSAVEDFRKASVDLEKEEAILDMNPHVEGSSLHKALPVKYSIIGK